MTSSSAPNAETGRIGLYSLLAKVGEGGMGVVHLAQAPTGERVALKVLRPHIVGDDEGRARLAREVTSLRRVRSHRVAEVHDADPWGTQPYVVTRYVDGPSLHERVREGGPLTGDELRSLALGLAEAVVAVHEVGVLHRDIKPSNVLIEGHEPVLIDFGLAKLAEDSRLTATGWLMGTPGYLAPEVLYGDEATPAADVHAWAATVVFAAVGATPFGKGPSMAVMDRARRGEFDLSGVPEELAPLLARCLSPTPTQRPSASEVVQRLSSPTPSRLGPAWPSEPPVTSTRPITAPVRRPPPPPMPQRPEPEPPARRSHPGIRAALMLGLLAAFAVATALAPYVTAAAALVLVWMVRTLSWSSDAIADRRALKGQRASDAIVQAVSAPWHLLVSFPGSVILLLSACLVFVVPALVLWVLGLQLESALFVGGLAGALALWWGPGSRRLRRQLRRVVWRASTERPTGWAWSGGVVLAAVLLAVALAAVGTTWWPADGPPFRPNDLVPPGLSF